MQSVREGVEHPLAVSYSERGHEDGRNHGVRIYPK